MLSVDALIPNRGLLIPAVIAAPEGAHGAPLVALVHGFGGEKSENGSNTKLAELLALRGIASVRMDLGGCGGSFEPLMGTISEMADDVVACARFAAEKYGFDLSRLGLMGLSLGGRVIMEIINNLLADPAVVSLTAPAALPEPLYAIAGGHENWLKNREYAKQHGLYPQPSIFGGFNRLSEKWFTEIDTHASLDAAREWKKGKMQVIYAADDAVVDPAISLAVAKAYGAFTVELTGDGHSFGIYSDKHELREKRNRIICDFISENI